MVSSPKISVLLPTYNYARYLPQAIASVLAQDFTDFELIISDDSSTDSSADIAGELAARDSRLRFHRHEPNLGMVPNWNWCLQQARGVYVKYVFGDDVLASPRALGRFNELLDHNPAASAAASARILLDGDSRVTGCWDELRAGLHDGPRLIAQCLRRRSNLIGEPSVVIFRRALADRGFDPRLRQLVDLEMWSHLLLQGSLAYTDEPLCGFRRHSAQQTVVNHGTRVSDLETIELLDRYLPAPAVQRHLQPGGWAHRQMLFRQRHYLRKAVTKNPTTVSALERVDRQLPAHSLATCWVWHRLTRPVQNLHRKATRWLARLPHARRRRQAGCDDFLRILPELPPLAVRPASASRASLPGWFADLAQGFEHRHPRRLATALLSIGVFCAAAILADWGNRPEFPPLRSRPPGFAADFGPEPDSRDPSGPSSGHNRPGKPEVFFPYGGRRPFPSGRRDSPPSEGEPRDHFPPN